MKKISTTIKNKKLVQKRRNQIVRAAIKLFSQKGFHGTTLRELAKETGLSYGNIYDYISTKEDIFYLIHEYAANLSMQALKSATENVDDPIEKLQRIIRAEFQLMDQLSEAILLIYQDTHILSPRFQHRLLSKEREHLQIIESAIEECIETGQLRSCNPRLSANLIKSMVDSWIIKRWDLRGVVDRLETEQTIIDIIFNGLKAYSEGLPVESKIDSICASESFYPDLNKQRALVVNSGTPIGTAISNRLLSNNVNLALYSSPIKLSKENPFICNSETEQKRFYDSDVHGPLNPELLKEIEHDFGRIDIYIQDLGAGTLSASNNKQTEFRERLEGNLRIAEDLIRMLRQEKNRDNPKRIIFIAPWGWDSYVDEVKYETVKAGAVALARNISREFSGRGVVSHCVIPGFIKSYRPSILENSFASELQVKIPAGILGELGDIVETVLFLISNRSKYVVAQNIAVDGGVMKTAD